MKHTIFSPAVFMLLIFFAGCRKTEQYKFTTDLAIDSRIVRVNADADTTRIIVYAEGNWNVAPLEDVSWIHLLNNSGSGKGETLIGFEDNNDSLPRAVKLIISSDQKTDTVNLQQKGLVPLITIADDAAQGIANASRLKTPINTNVPLALMTVAYQYETGSPANWISELAITDGYLYFKLDSNKSAQPRTGVLHLSYLDALGATTRDSITIKQHPGVDYSGAVVKDFAYIRQMLMNGIIEENIFIEGIVVSDKGHPNIAKNLNSATNKHTLTKTENAISVYVQSMDGSSGLYFKTKTPGDNIFNFNEHVKIWMKGASLEKLVDPDRAVISGIEALHIMSKEDNATPLMPKEKYMAQLTDNDLYTYVKLKDVEVSVPSGAFTNVNEGYTARMDCYPMNIRDVQGNSMYMLTNLDVPYRRDGNQVPQGSGSIAGILVHEELERYGGNIGRYSIRHLKRTDIALQESRDNGFSGILAEWSRFKTEHASAPTEAANPLTPDIGSGKLYRSGKGNLDFTSNGMYVSSDYNGLLPESTTTKGSVANGGWGSKSWWSNSAGRGEYWGIEVSTAGISSPLSMQIEGNTDIGGPRNFVVEWSDHNDETQAWNTAGSFTLQDLANWSNTLLTQVPGYKVVNIAFPAEASGLAHLYIRIRVANKSAGTSTSETGGTLGAATACRLGHISIKYNK